MLQYILEVSLCWLGFYSIYAFFLKKETFHQLNRGYLLGTMIFGLLIPLLEFPVTVLPEDNIAEYYLQTVTIGIERMNEAIVISAKETNIAPNLSFMTILFWIYLAGLIMGFIRFLYGLIQVMQIYHSGNVIERNGYTLIETQAPHLPFSFFNFLFWNKNLHAQDVDKQKIIRHEEAHIQQGHSWDVVLLELLSIVFWCSPLIYFYKNAIRVVHEYLADDFVLKISKKKPYSRLLLQQSQSGMSVALANHFFDSQLKKRLKMMTKTKSTNKALAKYLFLLPMLAFAVMIFAKEDVLNNLNLSNFTIVEGECKLDKTIAEAKFRKAFETLDLEKANLTLTEIYRELLSSHPDCNTEIMAAGFKVAHENNIELMFNEEGVYLIDKTNSDKAEKPTPIDESVVFEMVDQMPRFAGCEDISDKAERANCAQKKLFEYIFKNINYPKEAKEQGLEGMVVSQFVINADGQVKDIKIIKELGGGCDEEVIRIIGAMPKWIPGKKEGKNVNVQFKLPIKFKLDDKEPQKGAPAKTAMDPREVDFMPLFNGTEVSEGATADEKVQASNKKMIEFIFKNLKYPKTAAKEDVEGMVVAKFTVDNTGNVLDAKIAKSLHVDCDAEVLRVINAMPVWVPAQKGEKFVAVSMTLPIRFQLDDKTKEEAANTELPDAVQNLQVESFKIFPNPTNDIISVEFKTVKGATLLQIIDSSGKEVFSKNYKDYDGGTYTVTIDDIQSAQKGTLFIVLSQEKGTKKYAERVIYQ